jgi:outer membrane protein with beta-barrel domain
MRFTAAIICILMGYAASALAQADVSKFEAGPIVSSATVDESGLNPGYGARAVINISRTIGVEGYFSKHPLGDFESGPGTIVDNRASLQSGIDLKLTRRFNRHPFSLFVLGGPAVIHNTARWTYAGYSQTLKGAETTAHAGGGIELQLQRRWALRLDVTDTPVHAPATRDFPGLLGPPLQCDGGTMFRF